MGNCNKLRAELNSSRQIGAALPNMRTFDPERAPWFGLAALSAGVLFVGLLVVVPTGPAERAQARLTAFTVRETERGAYRVGVVDVHGARKQVRLPGHVNCRPGDRLTLIRQPHLWGSRYTMPANHRPCR